MRRKQILLGKSKENRPLEGLAVDGILTLKWMFQKYYTRHEID
jgi:hypothetical protein